MSLKASTKYLWLSTSPSWCRKDLFLCAALFITSIANLSKVPCIQWILDRCPNFGPFHSTTTSTLFRDTRLSKIGNTPNDLRLEHLNNFFVKRLLYTVNTCPTDPNFNPFSSKMAPFLNCSCRFPYICYNGERKIPGIKSLKIQFFMRKIKKKIQEKFPSVWSNSKAIREKSESVFFFSKLVRGYDPR